MLHKEYEVWNRNRQISNKKTRDVSDLENRWRYDLTSHRAVTNTSMLYYL